MILREGFRGLVLLSGLAIAALTHAYTIHVTTAQDEDLPSGGSGCSLREALQMRSNNDGVAYRGCSVAAELPAFAAGDPVTIVFDGDYTIAVNGSSSGDPSHHGSLNIPGAPLGALSIDGSGRSVTINCPAGINGSKIFVEAATASFVLSNLTMGGAGGCTASGAGIAIDNSSGGNLSISNVMFINIHSDSGGQGGAISHSSGVLSIAGANFTNNGTDNGSGSGNGGALYIGNITTASLTNTTFTGNTAANSGGAIYYSNNGISPYALTLSNVTFTGNIANGGATPDEGGGAIWAETESPATDLNAVFLISNGTFVSNTAPNGNGGAIFLAFDSRLAYANASAPNAGGVYGSNFVNNSTNGSPPNGAGGAIYSRGIMTVVQSSFLGNSSTFAGGGVATNDDYGTPTVIANSTFYGNNADLGGAIAKINLAGSLSLINDTVLGNSADSDGRSLYNTSDGTGGTTVTNSIIGDCFGAEPIDGGNNIQYELGGVAACDFGMPVHRQDPLLSYPPAINAPVSGSAVTPLVLTLAFGEMSPASGGGNPAVCSAGPINNTDATGSVGVRPTGRPNCDIGAYESGSVTPVELQMFRVE